MSNLQEFVDYVWAFYNPQSELYPIKGLTKRDIFDAFYVYKHRLLHTQNDNYTWGYGDTLDRESISVHVFLDTYRGRSLTVPSSLEVRRERRIAKNELLIPLVRRI